jgi:hypothetical protein
MMPNEINGLDLTGNPSIGQQGYEALLGLLNRRFNIGGVVVDDQNWNATLTGGIHELCMQPWSLSGRMVSFLQRQCG